MISLVHCCWFCCYHLSETVHNDRPFHFSGLSNRILNVGTPSTYILCKLLYNVLKTIALFQVGPFVYKAALQRSGDLKRLVLEMFAQDKAESAYFGFTLLFTAIMCHCIISIQFGFADFLREVSFGEVDILRPFCSNVSTMDCYPDFWQNFSSITSVCTFEYNCI